MTKTGSESLRELLKQDPTFGYVDSGRLIELLKINGNISDV